MLARGWARPLPGVGVGVLIAVAAFLRIGALSRFPAEASYVIALASGALALFVLSGVECAAWSRPSARQDLLLLLSVGAACATSTLGLQLAERASVTDAPGPAGLVGCAHLAALALVTRRLPLNPAARALVFLGSATAVPALLPTLRPLLDASPSFHAEHFSPWIEALAPILSLIVIAIALPSRARHTLVGGTSA